MSCFEGWVHFYTFEGWAGIWKLTKIEVPTDKRKKGVDCDEIFLQTKKSKGTIAQWWARETEIVLKPFVNYK